MRRLLRVGLALVALFALAAGAAWGFRHELARRALGLRPFTHSIGSRERLSVATRDGVGLATWVSKPEGEGPWPALLMRSPYPNIRRLLEFQCELYTRYGYACVLQDARGRGRSDGEWVPFVHERDDGIDTLRWLVAEPWTDGNVGLIGASYLGFTQWVLADALPPDVRTIVPAVTSTDRHATMYERGMFRTDVYTSWAVGNSGLESTLSPRERFWGAVRHRPALEADERFLGGRLPWYRDWLSQPAPEAKLWSDGVWGKLRSVPERTTVPVLMIAGWYDHNLAGMLEAYARLRSRNKSLLVIGPWLHTFQSAGMDLPSGFTDVMQIQLRWLEHQLKGEPPGEDLQGVHAYVIGEGFRSFASWPPRSERLRWYLSAPTAGGCVGALGRGVPVASATLTYRYDPDDPVPTKGGEALLGWAAGVDAPTPGRVEQDPPCARADVLSFVSDPLDQELVVVGDPKVHLDVASSADDTAFSVKLVEVDGRGRGWNLRDGIASLAYAGGAGPTPYTPARVVPLDFTLWPVAIRLAAGSRVRLDVSSSNFPAYHAHPNRAGPWAEQREARIATQTLRLGEAWLELPVPAREGAMERRGRGGCPRPRAFPSCRAWRRRRRVAPQELSGPAPGAARLRSDRRTRMTSRRTRRLVSTLCAAAALAAPAFAAEDVAPGAPSFKEGDTIRLDQVEKLKPFLPAEFWENRDFFFFEGMQMTIGPSFRDYSPPPVYTEATKKYSGNVKLGPENSLQNYRAGQPFPMEAIDCKGDPQAGAKIAWNFVLRWEGFGWGRASFFYSYWDRGEQLPLFYQGTSEGTSLAFRPEPEYDASDGDVFRGEKRYVASGPSVDAPFDARGIMLLTYRYKSSFGPKATAKNDDTWVYVPTLRRVRRISSAQRTDAVSGTDFTFDDLFSFNGVVPQYEWKCLGEMDLLAPVNSMIQAYPYEKDRNFGPFGLSFADDRWELRHALKFRFVPLNADHPYKNKDIYIDKNSMEPLFSFAYDRKGELWKLIWHNHRWSGDAPYSAVYKGWKSVPEPRDDTVVSDIVVNVQTGTGNRIEFWDRSLSPMDSVGKIRRFIDVGRLTKGR